VASADYRQQIYLKKSARMTPLKIQIAEQSEFGVSTIVTRHPLIAMAMGSMISQLMA